MNANPIEPRCRLTSIPGSITGMGREENCELLIEQRPLPGPRSLVRLWPPQTEWTLLRVPLNLPDGEYCVISNAGHCLRATRVDGFWIHHNPKNLQADTVPCSAPELGGKARQVAREILDIEGRYGISLLLLAVLITYGLPTIVELIAAHDLHLGLLVVLFGDLVGCACMATFLEMPVVGVMLYALLTGCEALLFFMGILSPAHLAWFADVVPMVVVTSRIARIRSSVHPAAGCRARLSS